MSKPSKCAGAPAQIKLPDAAVEAGVRVLENQEAYPISASSLAEAVFWAILAEIEPSELLANCRAERREATGKAEVAAADG